MKVLVANGFHMINAQLPEMASKSVHNEIVDPFGNETATLKTRRILKPDPGIIDIKMPGLNGLEVLREIRKENNTSKIIILSFYSSDHYRKKAYQYRADYYFNKSDDFDKVSQVIELMSEKVRE